MYYNNQYSQYPQQQQMGLSSQIQYSGFQQQLYQQQSQVYNGFVNQQSNMGQSHKIYTPKPISNGPFSQNQYVKSSSPIQFNQFSNLSQNNQDQYSENSTSCGSDENNQDDFLDQMPQLQNGLSIKQMSAASPVISRIQQVQHQQSNSTTQQKSKTNVVIPEEAKYKTEMCKNWVETGKCNYGDKCKFAHGKTQLVQKLAANKHFKTKQCKQFFENCVCNYGPRCHFVHDIRSVQEIQQDNQYSKKLNNPEVFLDLSSLPSLSQSSSQSSTSQPARRLDIFQQLTSSSSSTTPQ